MANANAAAKSTREDVKELSDQIGNLKNDIAEISRTLSSLGSHTRDAAQHEIRSSVAQFHKRGAENLEKAQATAEDLGNQAADAVRNQPATAVGLAVGVGFLLGFITGRK